MKKLPLFSIGIALLVSSCASRYTTLPPAAGVSPNPDALLKSMSTRLASAKQYRITATNTIPKAVAEALHQLPKNDVEILVARPDKLAVKISHNNSTVRKMIFDGSTFTVVDGVNNFYSKAALRGTLDKVPAHLAEIYGFQPPLAEFIVSDPYTNIKHHISSASYLGEGTVRENGKTTQCHRLGLHSQFVDTELWLGAADSLPRRLTATHRNSASKDLLVEINFLNWDMNPQINSSEFHYQPAAGALEIPMITVAEAKSVKN